MAMLNNQRVYETDNVYSVWPAFPQSFPHPRDIGAIRCPGRFEGRLGVVAAEHLQGCGDAFQLLALGAWAINDAMI